jgi:lipoprotein-releasing system permease protein
MNHEWHIARRLIFSKTNSQRTLRPVIGLTAASVAMGTAVMIIAMCVLIGFKQKITDKVTGYIAHIQITNYDGNASYQTNPIARNLDFMPQIEAMPSVRSIQAYSIKPGIITTAQDMQGVVLKGIDNGFDWTFFDAAMVEGSHFMLNDSAATNAVCISKTLANLLRLRHGDKFDMYFVQEPPRVRRFSIEGIFDTQFGELDKLYVLCDMRHVQRLNNWTSDQITGYEIFLHNLSMLDAAYSAISEHAFPTLRPDSERFMVENLRQRYAQIFDWLGLLDLNAIVIFVLMLMVAGFNMISGLLIVALERTPLIGLLSALGSTAASLRRIFVYQSMFIAARGLLWGNVIGIGLCLVQRRFDVISLNPDTYYLSVVPVGMHWGGILLLDAGALCVIALMLIVPSMIISKITPSQALRFA